MALSGNARFALVGGSLGAALAAAVACSGGGTGTTPPAGGPPAAVETGRSSGGAFDGDASSPPAGGSSGSSSNGGGAGSGPGSSAGSSSSGGGSTDGGSASGEGGSGVGGALDGGATCLPGQARQHNLNNDNWAGSLTLFISYSADTRTQTVDKGFSSDQWNAAVNGFDVPSFVARVVNTGAKNILLMLGQNTGYYDSPNSAYEMYAGVAAGTRCSTRDLPMELADALAAHGIGMYLYLPEDVGWGDTAAASHFGLTTQAVGNWVVDATFTPKWNAVVKMWADRYGSKVKGWFFDGYESRWGVTAAMAQTYRSTCVAANPCAVVTFNGQGSDAVSDTQRGETRINPGTGQPAKGLPTSRWDRNGLQVMWDFPLQAAWGQEIVDNSPPIYTDGNLKMFITAAIHAQAVFALDCRTSLAGALSTPVYDQLVRIKP